MMMPNRSQEKRDQSLFFQRGRVGAPGKPVGGRHDDGGHWGCADVWRQRHGVAACGQNHGTVWSSSIPRDRSADTHKKSFDNQRIGKCAHPTGPGLRKWSPAACGVQRARQRQPCVADSKTSLLGDRITYGRRNRDPAAVTAGSHASPIATISQTSSCCEGRARKR
jgi:hypothetical protein